MRSITLILFVILISCKDKPTAWHHPILNNPSSNLQYAKGFTIEDNGDFKIIEIKSPWPKSEKTYKYALINRDKAASISLVRDAFDGIVLTPVEKIVVTSTTHLPSLELLEVENALVGFPETNFISSKSIRKLVDAGDIRELGKNEEINTEVLLELQPELVIGFGIDASNKVFEQINNASIPVIYNGDWVEKTPLAKAEWLKFFGVLFEKETKAEIIFNKIEHDYNSAKNLASKSIETPTALSGAMHKDIWYLPSASSPEAQFFKDANINYLWKNAHGTGSLALSFESVLDKAKNAELWFSPSYFGSYLDLESANDHYTQFEAFKNQNVYSFVNNTGETGGVLYYELGTARPDLVLKDLIKIAHPDILQNYDLTFFEKLH